MKNVWIFGGAILAVFAFMLIFGRFSGQKSSEIVLPAEAPGPAQILEDDWTKGNPAAAVILTEYSDFECPACASHFPILSELTEIYRDKILFVYRHFPLTEIHLNAYLAARASEAAGRQGKFWEMHDRIFENQSAWRSRNGQPFFRRYAEQIGLDLKQFEIDLESAEIALKVGRDILSGREAGVPGTPTFFINGQKIQNPGSLDEFVSVIERFLAQQNEN